MNWQSVRLEVAVTLACNYRCPHCYAEGEPGRYESMTRSEVERIVADFAARGGKYLSFSGGEPTLRLPELMAGICAGSMSGMVVGISTNAWWAAKKLDRYLRLFSHAGLRAIGVSFDTYHAQGGAKWENVKAVLERARQYGILSHVMWGTRRTGEDLHREVVSVVGEDDADMVLYNVLRFGSVSSVGRAREVSALWAPMTPHCDQPVYPIVVVLPGRQLVWRCEARNPAFTYAYEGDWTETAERIEHSLVTRCRISRGLEPLIERAQAEYLDGCSLCYDTARAVYYPELITSGA